MCGVSYARFLSQPGGFALTTCVAACAQADVMCADKCTVSFPQAVASWLAWLTCIQQACNGPCML
jgi:hypothetical protein